MDPDMESMACPASDCLIDVCRFGCDDDEDAQQWSGQTRRQRVKEDWKL